MYVSFAPPRFAIALHGGSRTQALVTASGRFSLSVMADDQVGLAMRAGRSARTSDKFAELGADVRLGPNDTPALAEARARIWCVVVSEHEAGVHRLFFGEVEAWAVDEDDRAMKRAALVRHRRRYAAVGAWLSDEAPEGYPT
jgi:flavin reductase (DIM6/NTAB) family NADH-FMN oxidoreductase RutF